MANKIARQEAEILRLREAIAWALRYVRHPNNENINDWCSAYLRAIEARDGMAAGAKDEDRARKA